MAGPSGQTLAEQVLQPGEPAPMPATSGVDSASAADRAATCSDCIALSGTVHQIDGAEDRVSLDPGAAPKADREKEPTRWPM